MRMSLADYDAAIMTDCETGLSHCSVCGQECSSLSSPVICLPCLCRPRDFDKPTQDVCYEAPAGQGNIDHAIRNQPRYWNTQIWVLLLLRHAVGHEIPLLKILDMLPETRKQHHNTSYDNADGLWTTYHCDIRGYILKITPAGMEKIEQWLQSPHKWEMASILAWKIAYDKGEML